VADCGALERIGSLAEHAHRAVRIVNVDHHLTNSLFGDINYVDRAASSCGELVYRIVEAGKVPITKELADCLYGAILTDTGRFSYANTTTEAFEICARLVRAGACPYELAEKLCHSPLESMVRLQGLAIGTLRLEAEGRIATMEITSEMFERTGARPVDTQGLADIPVSIKGVMASALLKELPGAPKDCCIKASLRSRPSGNAVDVCAVAEAFGGGGHRHAAGCELSGPLCEARRAVVEMLRRQLKS
jgi:phosphoesterase RecJ-like protein